MDEASHDVAPSNAYAVEQPWTRIGPRDRSLEPKCPVGPGLVVVSGVGPEHLPQVTAAEHEHPVQAFGS
jgi:hypothetical protein